MPVREALKQLEVEGLVVMYPYRGVEVARLDPAAIREMFGIRVALERLAVAKACENLRASHFRAMEEMLQTMDGQLGHPTEDDPWMRLNGAFHAVINQASEWPRLVETIDQFRGNVERYVRTYLSYRGREQSQREHWDLFEALSKRNADAAQAVIEKHLVNTADALVEAIEAGDAAIGGRDAAPAPVRAR